VSAERISHRGRSDQTGARLLVLEHMGHRSRARAYALSQACETDFVTPHGMSHESLVNQDGWSIVNGATVPRLLALSGRMTNVTKRVKACATLGLHVRRLAIPWLPVDDQSGSDGQRQRDDAAGCEDC